MLSIVLLGIAAVASALQPLPPVDWVPSDSNGFHIASVDHTIYIYNDFAQHRDENGLTLIPPSAIEFADTFSQDLEEVTGHPWTVRAVDAFPEHGSGIFLGSSDGAFTYENGEPTEEGYELEIKSNRVFVRGTGARGMWWGTRTLLQLLIINDGHISAGRTVDAPSFATRGFLLDAGRKWYSPSFLKDLCTYASFFKMSEFHYHTSDNYPLNRGHNETWQDVYAQFSLHPENPDLQELVQRANETLSRAEYEDLEHHCAQRGVTVIPEIESPGHCLFLTKWKPELALDTKKDLLNLSHPDTVPLVKSIWAEFLPWFHTKEVNIGADEYDPTLADDYIDFVNELAEFVKQESGKRVRIWGTYEPSETRTISKDIIIQHWQYGQSDPVQLANDGYELINSEDWWAYMSLKNDHMPILPAPYPAFFNNSRVLDFADREGWQWSPALFNPYNITEQPDQKPVKGALLAAWNDNGPDATTQLEAFYAIRNGIPTVASRSWSGNRGPKLDLSSLDSSMDLLTSKAVAQNLDRNLNVKPSESKAHVQWRSAEAGEEGKVHLGYGSKGMNYTLELDVTGPFVLSSNDSSLALSSDGALTFISDGWDYPLRSVDETDGFDAGFPGRIWTNETSSTHEPVTVPLNSHITVRTDVIGGSRVWVDGDFAGRFEVFVFGGKNTLFSWSQMAFVAPLEWVEGGINQLQISGYNGQH
ncbi:hypothetical protein ASPVEDRAFT_47661 [Aspergillus versicolor CBS 583.65]|uniref:beta-N-acetylhexosaminidase n=1 Tax=Aspergillus versicolor CBS 583.65 TaxID=1036611 RepID=A0A1L9Q424_ASPVE|nr:uncharacterized protein ASPVEDRAFT_47661 [Aspergillus versicolor CBS 583.65]OJJ08511.1 hypothetical protein ASPVEDRAFT_47661 [Aspergillus versicolor CBS 583.65]